jgi:hypothetical protein
MGDLIAFKPATGSDRSRAAPIDFGTIVFFTGVRHERLKDYVPKSKPSGGVSGKRPIKRRRKSATSSRVE